MLTREEYMIALAEGSTEEECRTLFDLDRDTMLDGSAVWNEAIEYAYNAYCTEVEWEEEQNKNK